MKNQNVATSAEANAGPRASGPVKSSRIEEQKEAFKEDLTELTDSIKGLGKTLKGGFSGLFKKKKQPAENN